MPVANAGRLKCLPDKICSNAWAWIATPGTALCNGVARRSRRPGALTPISTKRPSTSPRSNFPSSTRCAEMSRTLSWYEKWSHISPFESDGTSIGPKRITPRRFSRPNASTPLPPEDRTKIVDWLRSDARYFQRKGMDRVRLPPTRGGAHGAQSGRWRAANSRCLCRTLAASARGGYP